MTLKGLLTLLTQRPEFRRLIQRLHDAEGIPALTGITESARPYVLAALASSLRQPLLLVVTNEGQANEIADTLKVLVENPKDILFLPDRDALPYERLISDAETTQQRMNALICLAERERNAMLAPDYNSIARCLPVMPNLRRKSDPFHASIAQMNVAPDFACIFRFL